jgi:hypothetical protein
MHRHLLRRHLHPQFIVWLFGIAALVLQAGCGFVYPPPAIPDVVQNQIFHMGAPIALLSFDPGRMSGRIAGELHGWPFPHLEGTEGISTGTFTYVGQFNVIAKSDDDGMPAGAEGSRKVYFHETPPHLDLSEPRGYATGQETALDSLSMSFTFRENHRVVNVRMISQQKSAHPFTFRGKKIEPPPQRDTSDEFRGEYSADHGGYILHSLNE